MIIVQRDYQDLPGRNRRFRRHRHPSRRFPASVQDTTASIHRLAYRPCCPCSSNSGQVIVSIIIDASYLFDFTCINKRRGRGNDRCHLLRPDRSRHNVLDGGVLEQYAGWRHALYILHLYGVVNTVFFFGGVCTDHFVRQ